MPKVAMLLRRKLKNKQENTFYFSVFAPCAVLSLTNMESGWEGKSESDALRIKLMREELARDREVKARSDFGSGSIVNQKSWHNNDINRGFQNRGVHRQAGMVSSTCGLRCHFGARGCNPCRRVFVFVCALGT